MRGTRGSVRHGLSTWSALLAGGIVLAAGCGGEGPASIARAVGPTGEDRMRAAELRDATLASARVWSPPAVPIPEADLSANPDGPGHFDADRVVECRFSMDAVSGTTPKFYCELPTGERL